MSTEPSILAALVPIAHLATGFDTLSNDPTLHVHAWNRSIDDTRAVLREVVRTGVVDVPPTLCDDRVYDDEMCPELAFDVSISPDGEDPSEYAPLYRRHLWGSVDLPIVYVELWPSIQGRYGDPAQEALLCFNPPVSRSALKVPTVFSRPVMQRLLTAFRFRFAWSTTLQTLEGTFDASAWHRPAVRAEPWRQYHPTMVFSADLLGRLGRSGEGLLDSREPTWKDATDSEDRLGVFSAAMFGERSWWVRSPSGLGTETPALRITDRWQEGKGFHLADVDEDLRRAISWVEDAHVKAVEEWLGPDNLLR